MAAIAKSAVKSSKKTKTPARVLYLYAISRMPSRTAPVIAAEGIDGKAPIEAVRCDGYICWTSRVSKAEFADGIEERMQDLDWLASAGLRHQRAVAEIASKLPTLPARFGTVFLSEESLLAHVQGRKVALGEAFERVTDADEWGVKIFALAPRKSRAISTPSSGADYLKRKAELLQPRAAGKLDPDVTKFISQLQQMSVAAAPGGKASAGQPGLLWHGSFLIRRKDRKKLDLILQKYATTWKDTRRIDCSGPWPAYSFVGENAN